MYTSQSASLMRAMARPQLTLASLRSPSNWFRRKEIVSKIFALSWAIASTPQCRLSWAMRSLTWNLVPINFGPHPNSASNFGSISFFSLIFFFRKSRIASQSAHTMKAKHTTNITPRAIIKTHPTNLSTEQSFPGFIPEFTTVHPQCLATFIVAKSQFS